MNSDINLDRVESLLLLNEFVIKFRLKELAQVLIRPDLNPLFSQFFFLLHELVALRSTNRGRQPDLLVGCLLIDHKLAPINHLNRQNTRTELYVFKDWVL